MPKVIYISFLLLLVTRPAMSCSANEYPSFEEAARSEPILLLVKVVKINTSNDNTENKVALTVLNTIKGENINKEISLYEFPCFQHIYLLDLKKDHEYLLPLNRESMRNGEYRFLNNIRTLIEHKDGKLYTVAGQIKEAEFYKDYNEFIKEYGI